MKLSIIIPVFNNAHELRECLRALRDGTRVPDEIVVANDGSTDESAQVALEFGARLVQVEDGPRGPAVARNRGAHAATGDILLFVDSDVRVHPDTLERVEKEFASSPELSALFGSYDAAPPMPNLVSRYYNLRHHFVHQAARQDAWTFWSGLGAVRRDAFFEVGGFDEKFRKSSVEDIAFGRELRARGHTIRLCPDVQATHLKRWTAKQWLRTDIFARAIPWTRILLEDSSIPADLNFDPKSRLSAVVAWLSVFLALGGTFSPLLLVAALLGMGVWLGLNAPILRFFARRGGVLFATGAVTCHFLYYLYSSATFGLLLFAYKTRSFRRRMAHYSVALLLLAALSKGLMWALIVPAWQAPDEPQQFLYAHEMGRTRQWIVPPQLEVPPDARRLGLLTLQGRLDDGSCASQTQTAAIAQTLATLDNDRGARVIDGGVLIGQPGFNLYHPPLAFALTALAMEPWSDASVRWRLLAARFLSVLWGVLAVGIAFAIGREIWPGRRSWALCLGALVAWQPMSAFTLATVSNESLGIALFSALLLLGLRVLRDGMTLRRGVLVGGLLTLGLLTKVSFLSAFLLWGGLAVWHCVAAKPRHLNKSAWGVALLLPMLVCAPWYFHTLKGNVVERSFGQFAKGKVSLISTPNSCGARPPDTESVLRRRSERLPVWSTGVKYGRVFVSFWSSFGWTHVRAPRMVWLGIGVLSLWALFSALRQFPALDTQKRRALWFLAAGTVSLIVFYALVDFHNWRSTGGGFGLRGAYYLPAISGIMTWFALGIAPLAGVKRFRPALIALGMAGLSAFSLWGVVASRYYETSAPLLIWQRCALYQLPLPSSVGTAVVGAVTCVTMVLSLLLVVTMMDREKPIASSLSGRDTPTGASSVHI